MSNNKENPTTIIKRAQSRFISIDEFCIDNLSMHALAVYMQLRLLSDFSKAYDEIKITISCLAERSKMSERKVYDALNELEDSHFVIQRLNYHHFRYGKVNSYNVARDYNYFKNNEQIDQPLHTPAQNDSGVQSSTTPAPYAGVPAPYAGVPAQNDIPNTTRSSSIINSKKQNKGPVPVFSDSLSVKNHIEKVVANRDTYVEDEVLDQGVYYAYETNPDKSFDSVMKRINIFLKKVREGMWLIPQGYQGLTSQSIREDEEQYQREKEAQYRQEAQAMQNITESIATGAGFKGFQDMLQKLKRA